MSLRCFCIVAMNIFSRISLIVYIRTIWIKLFVLLFFSVNFNAYADSNPWSFSCGWYYEGDSRIEQCVANRIAANSSAVLVDRSDRYQGMPREQLVWLTFCPASEPVLNSINRCTSAPPPDPCEMLADMCSGSQGMSTSFSLPGRKAGVSFTCMSPVSVGADAPLPGCTKGCMAQVGGFTTAYQDNSGAWVTTGTAKYSGATCDPSVINDLNSEADPEYVPEENPKTSDKADPSCPNGFKGTVNGVSVCVPPKGSSGITELEEKDNGDGTKTNTKTEVKCENGKCEVTKTSTTTNTTTNNTVSSSSVTTTVDKADYCSKNSSAGVCKNEQGEEEGKGSFGGSCQAGFTCKGDAAMCAMAKEQHKRNCETLEEDKDPSSFFNQVKNGTDSQSAKAMQDNASEINIATQLNKNGYGWSRSCPANTRIDLSFVSGSFEMPFDKLCGPLKIFSDIALAITALSLLVWLVFAGREKAGT